MKPTNPKSFCLRYCLSVIAALGCLSLARVSAATAVIYTNDFESYSAVATSPTDTSDADPTGVEWNIADDTALSPTTAGAGVQVIDWLTNSAGLPNKSLLLQPSSEAQIMFRNARSGTRYQLDFSTYAVRQPTSDRNFYVILRGEGSDYNGDDYLAYQVNRGTNSTVLRYYDGVGPGAGAWVSTAASQTTEVWQHHRIVIDPNALTFTLYVDDMATPVVTGADLSRCEVGVPTMIRILNEGNSADDGWYAIDDFSFTVDDSRDLATAFTEGFEGYTPRTGPDDNANPGGPWVTTELDGTGTGRVRALSKVQVVSTDVVSPHSGTNCLLLQGGQRAGVSLAWGLPPETDVEITWWARVPATVTGGQYTYLRMSLYAAENGNTISGDCALLGYGVRDATTGRPTSLTYYTTAWVDSQLDFTPDTWEEYRLTTHNSQGKYTIIKNPSSASPVLIADRKPMIGTASVWGPTLMAGWSSSNGTNHPPVFVDDITVRSLVSNPDPLPIPYTVQFDGGRFTNVTAVTLNVPLGSVAVDPRDSNTIVVAVDASGGSLYQLKKVASGNWSLDPKPLVTGLDRPSGMTIAPDGTIWWVHDYTMALMRLKAPWSSSLPERVIADFGVTNPDGTFIDDDPFDVCIAPPGFDGAIGKPGQVVVVDRGLDGDAYNALLWVDPATTLLDQTNYANYLIAPTSTGLGSKNIVAMTTLPTQGQIVTVNLDGQISVVDANGTENFFWPTLYADPFVPIQPASLATDPTTGRIWLADDLMDQVWSVAPDGVSSADKKELSFPLTNPSRTDLQISMHEPGMAFSPDGKFLAISDGSVSNGGGRLLILHNEVISLPTFSITSVVRSAQGIQLSWQSAGAAKYRVQRSATLDGAAFVDLTEDLTTTQYTDTNAITGNLFYRVVAKP